MQQDIRDLKQLIFELITTNNLEVPKVSSIPGLPAFPKNQGGRYQPNTAQQSFEHQNFEDDIHVESGDQPLLISQDPSSGRSSNYYEASEVVDEILSLEENVF